MNPPPLLTFNYGRDTLATARYPSLFTDMRFMQGNFRGTDRRVHQGAFALV